MLYEVITREKRLARAGGAEHARRALDELVHIDADRMSLLAGIADDEIGLIGRVAEDLGDVALRSQTHPGVMLV